MPSSQHSRELSYAVRLHTVGRHFGDLLMVLAVLNSVPAVVALLSDGWSTGWPYLVSVLALAAIGALLHRLRPGAGIQTNEAFVVTAATFVTAALAMSFPLMANGLAFEDALLSHCPV
jgi:Trk-type K+ transport system membrane component